MSLKIWGSGGREVKALASRPGDPGSNPGEDRKKLPGFFWLSWKVITTPGFVSSEVERLVHSDMDNKLGGPVYTKRSCVHVKDPLAV